MVGDSTVGVSISQGFHFNACGKSMTMHVTKKEA